MFLGRLLWMCHLYSSSTLHSIQNLLENAIGTIAFGASLRQNLLVAAQQAARTTTWVERLFTHIRENPWVTATIFVATGVIAVAKYARDIRELIETLRATPVEKARATLASLKLDFTADVFVQCAERGDRHGVELFLKAGMDPNARNRDGSYALTSAAKREDLDMIETLLKAKADIAVTDAGYTALEIATWSASEAVIKMLLKKKPGTELLNSGLVHAAVNGNKHMLKLLVEGGAQVESVGAEALIEAASKPEKVENVRYLLRCDVDPNSRDEKGRTALEEAASQRSRESLRALLEAGADPNSSGGTYGYYPTALTLAVRVGDMESVTALLDAGADVNAAGGELGLTALLAAADRTSDDGESIMKVLLARGARVNARNANGETALMLASSDNKLPLVSELLRHGADVNLQSSYGRTALMESAHDSRARVLPVLLNHGADVNVKDRDGESALSLAVCAHNSAAVRLLLDHTADIDACNSTGKTPLMLAAEQGAIEVLRILLDGGADLTREDQDGRTALDFAEDYSDAKDKAAMLRILKAAQEEFKKPKSA